MGSKPDGAAALREWCPLGLPFLPIVRCCSKKRKLLQKKLKPSQLEKQDLSLLVDCHNTRSRKMSTAAAPVPAGAEISGSEITSTLVSSHSSLSNPSSSSSSSNSDSDSDSDDSSDEEAETTARLKALLLKAKASARAKAESVAKGKTGDGLAGQDEVVLFGGEADSDDEEEYVLISYCPCTPG